MSSALTTVRTAVWQAIQYWTWPTGFVWNKQYSSDADVAALLLQSPGVAALPALALEWREITIAEQLHIAQRYPIAAQLVAWVPGDQLTLAETLAEELLRAVLQCSPATTTPGASTVPYVRAACSGNQVRPIGPIRVEPVTLGRAGQLHVWRVSVSFTCPLYRDLYKD